MLRGAEVKARLAPEGYPFVGASLLMAFIAFFIATWACVVFTAVTLFMMYFFRDPDRTAPPGENVFVSPADGKIILVQKVFSLIGPFPYKTFAVVENNYQTGYSFPTYTLLGSQVIRLPLVETSLGHEILHQWFGNYGYADYGKGNWAEGITTYLADQWYSHLKGPGAEYRKKLLTDYMNYVTTENEITLSSFKSPDSYTARAVGYGKAAMVFHLLRKKLGDEVFFKSLKKFVETFRFREASWDDMRNSFMAESGQDLKGFFQRGGGYSLMR